MPPQNPKELEISRSKAWPWYQKEVGDKITQVARDLLENYSGIAPEKVEEHVYKAVCYLEYADTSPCQAFVNKETH